MALVDQRQLTTGTWLRRVLAVVLTVAALTPSIGAAQQPDPERPSKSATRCAPAKRRS